MAIREVFEDLATEGMETQRLFVGYSQQVTKQPCIGKHEFRGFDHFFIETFMVLRNQSNDISCNQIGEPRFAGIVSYSNFRGEGCNIQELAGPSCDWVIFSIIEKFCDPERTNIPVSCFSSVRS